ncbi:DEKNAAC103597 [Brettanomyces naardenensis]|uniref:Nascent polypeptide-associated complex subunit alpha n=1 Tax=Brettanomyces naardenensis TaxID=13370 RepID=A0A448YNW0_BRENA|nr:DEKNAAC103597 [Brettanomyces naardenensis]
MSAETTTVTENQIPAGANVSIVPKHEKKAKEQLLKLGLKPLKDISRVTFRKKGNFILAIDNPEVFRTQGGSYIVFGEAKVEDLNKRYAEAVAAQNAAQQAGAQAEGAEGAESISTTGAAADAITEDLKKASLEDEEEKKEEEDDDKEEDATGLEQADIDVIVEQTNVSKNKAIRALREHKGDVVNAIMSLTQ